MYREIKRCLICGNPDLVPILDLGRQALTGVFPKSKAAVVGKGPLQLIKCAERANTDHCGLVQLRHLYDGKDLYGETYGYRSSLNGSMVHHLTQVVGTITQKVALASGDLILDIGSNDGTLLKAYSQKKMTLAGIDPLGENMRAYYPPHIRLISDFFSQRVFEKHFGSKKAKVVTSIAMFYDLKTPLQFMGEVSEILSADGVWFLEQSYMPTMLAVNSYDTVCHEHLEYYRLKQIKWMADRAGLKIIDVAFNDINGGSFSVMVAKKDSPYREATQKVHAILREEQKSGLGTLRPYQTFHRRILRHREALCARLARIRKTGQTLLGYGASTKGNVILQFCGLGPREIPAIAEVNADKFHSYTPGTLIPIISEQDARAMRPDYFLVLPWHFKKNIVARESEYLKQGGRLLFPLPKLEVIS